ncbi:hypothetical protein Bbelb_177320 [Branchiostoma belcheri]|nr:hypothetical protein Bbelb_177320 [Branchiostoma belcheri]
MRLAPTLCIMASGQDDSDHYHLGPSQIWSTRPTALVNSAHRPGQLGPSAWSTRPIALKARKSKLPFYLLVDLLYQESKIVKTQVRMVCEGRLRRHQRRKYVNLQGRIFKAWADFESGRYTAKNLLAACSRFYGPTIRHVRLNTYERHE